MLNRIILQGRFVSDPEMRRTGNGTAVTSFTIAVDRDFANQATGERETDFIDIVAWRNTAEFVNKYFTKGRMAVVQGRLQIRQYTDKDGNKRKAAEVVADSVYFADSNKDSHAPNRATQGSVEPQSGYATGGYSPYGSSAIGQPPQDDFALLGDDQSELPF